MPAVSIWMSRERAVELRRVALRRSLAEDKRVTLSLMAREALEAMWPEGQRNEQEDGKEGGQ